MKQLWLTLLVAALIAPPLAAQTTTAPAPPKTPQDQASYHIGMNIGKSLFSQGLDAKIVNPAMLARGIIDALTQAKPALTEAESAAAMQQFQQMSGQAIEANMMARQKALQAEQAQAGAKNKAAGDAYLAANGKKAGVKTLPSGLQYRVIKPGTGASPKATDVVRVHYTGKLTNGQKFDSSVDSGKPAEFPVNGVIRGWTEALQLMKAGGKWELVIPSALAYGPQGRPPVIPPNSVLVFEVELLEVKAQ